MSRSKSYGTSQEKGTNVKTTKRFISQIVIITLVVSMIYVSSQTAFAQRNLCDPVVLRKTLNQLKQKLTELQKKVVVLNKKVAKQSKQIKVIPRASVIAVTYKQWHRRYLQGLQTRLWSGKQAHTPNWAPTGRSLIFVKKRDKSAIKVTYNDNLLSVGKKSDDSSCLFAVYIDGKQCSRPGPIKGLTYTRNGHGDSQQNSLIGVCLKAGGKTIGKGRHTISIQYASARPKDAAHSKCHLGWHSSSLIMVEEFTSPLQKGR